MDYNSINIDKIANKLYELTKDLDFADYEESKKQEIGELIDAIDWIKTAAQNEYNKDYWRTFFGALARLEDL